MFNTQETPEVKGRILEVARDLFIRKGYKGTSIREIAAASETNVAMVNYYFQSKYNLFEIIFEDALDILAKRLFTTINAEQPFFEMIESWVNAYYEIFLAYPQIPIFILNEISREPERLTNRLRKLQPHSMLLKISEYIKQEISKGTIREISPVDLLLNILSLAVFPFMFQNLVIPMAEISEDTYQAILEERKTSVVNFIINAIKVNE